MGKHIGYKLPEEKPLHNKAWNHGSVQYRPGIHNIDHVENNVYPYKIESDRRIGIRKLFFQNIITHRYKNSAISTRGQYD